MVKNKKYYAHVITADGRELAGAIDSPYELRTAINNISLMRPESVVMIGDYLAVRAGDFMRAFITLEDVEEVKA